MSLLDGFLKKTVAPVAHTFHAAAQLAGAEPTRQTALRGGAYNKAPKVAANLAYQSSGASDMINFMLRPSLTNAALAAMALPVPGKVIPLGEGRKLVRASRVLDETSGAIDSAFANRIAQEKFMRKVFAEDLVRNGMTPRGAARAARDEFGVPVKYKLYKKGADRPHATSEYTIHPDRVWFDKALNVNARTKAAPIDIRDARDLFRMPFEALEGNTRMLDGIVAHKSGRTRMPDLIKALARRQGLNIRLSDGPH